MQVRSPSTLQNVRSHIYLRSDGHSKGHDQRRIRDTDRNQSCWTPPSLPPLERSPPIILDTFLPLSSGLRRFHWTPFCTRISFRSSLDRIRSLPFVDLVRKVKDSQHIPGHGDPQKTSRSLAVRCHPSRTHPNQSGQTLGRRGREGLSALPLFERRARCGHELLGRVQ